MGSKDFSVIFLNEIIKNGFEIVKVFTREPKPAGRNKILTKTPVHAFCENNYPEICIETPRSLKNFDLNKETEVDFVIVVGYGLILPKSFIDFPKIGCLNVHPSRLPRWRGACPIERSLWNGDEETAATIMLMDEGLDTGDILSEEGIKIEENDNFDSLSANLADSAKKQLISVMKDFDFYEPRKQSEFGMIYAEKIKNEDRRLDLSSIKICGYEVHNRIRALSGKSGLIVRVRNFEEEFKVLEAEFFRDEELSEGELFLKQKNVYIGFQDGVLMLKKVQRTIGKGSLMSGLDFFNFLSSLGFKKA